jgi:hypothetical protein
MHGSMAKSRRCVKASGTPGEQRLGHGVGCAAQWGTWLPCRRRGSRFGRSAGRAHPDNGSQLRTRPVIATSRPPHRPEPGTGVVADRQVRCCAASATGGLHPALTAPCRRPVLPSLPDVHEAAASGRPDTVVPGATSDGLGCRAGPDPVRAPASCVVGELGQQEEPPRCTSLSTNRLAVQRMHGSRPQGSAFWLEEEDQKPGKLFGTGFARRPALSAGWPESRAARGAALVSE